MLGSVKDLEDGEDLMAAAECAAKMYDANLLDAEDEEWGPPSKGISFAVFEEGLTSGSLASPSRPYV